MAKIGKPVDRGEWGMTPPTVNAYYDPQMNDINFPAGVLQPPLFDPKMDDAPNYGDTGGTIGHELTHGFDDEGRQFDAHGNLHDWWTEADAEEFQKRADCVANQYAQYTVVDDIKINGKLTLGEDVADLGGTMLAYMAWKDATQGPETDAHRRIHSRAALLHRHGAVGLRRRTRREQARACHHRSAFAAGVSHQRRGVEHAGIRQGVLLQGRPADGAERSLPGVVRKQEIGRRFTQIHTDSHRFTQIRPAVGRPSLFYRRSSAFIGAIRFLVFLARRCLLWWLKSERNWPPINADERR